MIEQDILKFLLVRITWNYGGSEVYIIGSFTNWDYMIKLHKVVMGGTPIFEISMVRKIRIMNLSHSMSRKVATTITS